MPRKITERLIERSDRHIVVAIDPHDGDCHGAHDIIIEANFLPKFFEDGRDYVAMTYTWGPSALLSQNGTTEFRDGLTKALERGEEIKKELLDAERTT